MNSQFHVGTLLYTVYTSNTSLGCQQECQKEPRCEHFQLCSQVYCNLMVNVSVQVCHMSCSSGPQFCLDDLIKWAKLLIDRKHLFYCNQNKNASKNIA